MPELPEVEHLRRSLEPVLLGRHVVRVTVHRRDIVCTPDDPPGGFSRQSGGIAHASPRIVRRAELLLDAEISALERHGKRLAILSNHGDGPALDAHLGMTGQLIHLAKGHRLTSQSHIHVSWRLSDGSRLVYRDARRFGGIWTCRDREDLQTRRWGPLGPDALTASSAELITRTKRTRRPVKAALLDQTVLAGVGNIYADESLHRARLSPFMLACDLTAADWCALVEALRVVLNQAIVAGGSTIRDYVDGMGRTGVHQIRHAVYGQAGKPCTRCGARLRSARIGQRQTVWCAACQPGP